ncbi:MAG: hypothetical protein K0R99_3009 [Microbacterium sp.]|nr:hypothetical protein [Microbacterium sp.]
MSRLRSRIGARKARPRSRPEPDGHVTRWCANRLCREGQRGAPFLGPVAGDASARASSCVLSRRLSAGTKLEAASIRNSSATGVDATAGVETPDGFWRRRTTKCRFLRAGAFRPGKSRVVSWLGPPAGIGLNQRFRPRSARLVSTVCPRGAAVHAERRYCCARECVSAPQTSPASRPSRSTTSVDHRGYCRLAACVRWPRRLRGPRVADNHPFSPSDVFALYSHVG